MPEFNTAIDICNRAIQRVGATYITSLDTTVDTTKEADECSRCYGKLRRAEMRRNVWRFSIRRALLRAVGSALPAWDSGVTYVVGSLVSYNSVNYISIHVTNLNQNPATATSYWAVFTGNTSQKITFANWAIGTTYVAGAIITGTDGQLYLSMLAGNIGHDPTTDSGTYWTLYFGPYVASAYDSTMSYSVGEIVFDTAQAAYYSTENGNTNNPSTGIGWATLSGATLAPLVIPWPAGTGPATDPPSRNVFVLPYGYLRHAPENPTAGNASYLGFPSNAAVTDWAFEGGYLTSCDPGPIMLRFAADVTQVTLMDDLFCEGLASRIAFEICEPLTQSGSKLQAIGAEYKEFMNDARQINGIEVGSVQPPLDDFIACRA